MIAANLTQPEALTIADVDGNGTPDIVVGTDRSVDMVRATARRQLCGSHRHSTGLGQVFDIASGDVDGDGQLDLVSASFFDSQITLFRNQSRRGDFDGDGSVDAADIDRLCAAIREGSDGASVRSVRRWPGQRGRYGRLDRGHPGHDLRRRELGRRV